MAKLVLDMSAVQDEFFSESAMIGIGCPLQGYEFCWKLNRHMNFSLRREPEYDVEYKPAKNDVHYFSLYKYTEPYSNNTHLLYKLKSDKNALLPEIKQLDYLWLIKSREAEVLAEALQEDMRSMPDIMLARVIEPERLKNINHLLL